jgi:hypothetical protein
LVAIVVVVNAGYPVGLIDYVLVGGGQGFVLVKPDSCHFSGA